MTDAELFDRIDDALSAVSADWAKLKLTYGEISPTAEMIAQLGALVAERSVSFASVRVEDPDALEDLSVDIVVFTDTLVVRGKVRPGKRPSVTCYRRNDLTWLTVQQAPDPSRRTLGRRLQVELQYPSEVLSLPFQRTSAQGHRRFALFLPSLVLDLERPRGHP
ncbi:hypothetical protein [Naasia sp.]|uniref:hypothetical protein n=1 Tax=Naasia sp. TaxID=2546198 RepID=UPI002623C1F3|nr:hypothetical protein [Naasia sp.]